MLQPFLIFQEPVDGFTEALFEGDGRFPAQVVGQFGGVDGVAFVVAGPVFYVGNQFFGISGRLAGFLIYLPDEFFD